MHESDRQQEGKYEVKQNQKIDSGPSRQSEKMSRAASPANEKKEKIRPAEERLELEAVQKQELEWNILRAASKNAVFPEKNLEANCIAAVIMAVARALHNFKIDMISCLTNSSKPYACRVYFSKKAQTLA